MMMRMLDAAGLNIVTDEIREADEDNPRGYFELERVKELDKGGDKSWLPEHRGKVVKIISFLLTDLPATCFYKVIFMRRDLDEVIASQNKMLVRRDEKVDGDDEKMKELYGRHLRKLEVLLGERLNFELLDVHYREVINDPLEQARRVGKFLDVSDRTDAMAEAVDPSLYRNRG